MDVIVDERTLREIYLRPLEMAVKQARPWAVMTSYNLVDGVHADAHRRLLDDVLRGQWGFDGLVMSDWGGTNSCGEAIAAGLDLEMPEPAIQRTFENVSKALQSGEISEEALGRRVRAVLDLVRKAGKLDSPDIPEETAVDLPSSRKLIREAGADGMVLLKNGKSILPINLDEKKDGEGVESIALIGLAKHYLGHGGGSAQINSHRKITPYEAFEEAVREKNSNIKLNYAEGVRPVRSLSPLSENVFDEDGKPGFTLRVWIDENEEAGHPKLTYNVPSATFVSRQHRNATSASLTGIYKPSVAGSHLHQLRHGGQHDRLHQRRGSIQGGGQLPGHHGLHAQRCQGREEAVPVHAGTRVQDTHRSAAIERYEKWIGCLCYGCGRYGAWFHAGRGA